MVLAGGAGGITFDSGGKFPDITSAATDAALGFPTTLERSGGELPLVVAASTIWNEPSLPKLVVFGPGGSAPRSSISCSDLPTDAARGGRDIIGGMTDDVPMGGSRDAFGFGVNTRCVDPVEITDFQLFNELAGEF